jgi:single-stranded DNA-binding protein
MVMLAKPDSFDGISHTEWHRFVVFGKLSEFAKMLTKGAHVQVETELRLRPLRPLQFHCGNRPNGWAFIDLENLL